MSRLRWIGAALVAVLIALALLATCEGTPGPDSPTVPVGTGEQTPSAAKPRAAAPTGRAARAAVPGTASSAEETAPNPARSGPEGPGALPMPATPDPAAPLPPVVAKRVRGRVLDLGTGAPIAAAKVLLAVFDAGGIEVPTGNWAATTASDGWFEVGPGAGDKERRAMRIDVRAVSDGYLPATGPAEDGVILRLEWRRGPQPRGRVSGLVTDDSGRPHHGLVQISATNAVGEWNAIWVVADAAGAFTVDGLAAGAWAFSLAGGTRQEATVPEGDETRVHVRAKRIWLDDRVDGDPQRPVQIAAPDGALHVRLHLASASSMYFRSPVVQGVASFAAVPVGKWRAEFESDGAPLGPRNFVLEKGEGPALIGRE